MADDVTLTENRHIYKWELPIEDEPCVAMPRGARVLCVQAVDDRAYVWAMTNPLSLSASHRRRFFIVPTGRPMPEKAVTYVGTFQLYGGKLVFHVWE